MTGPSLIRATLSRGAAVLALNLALGSPQESTCRGQQYVSPAEMATGGQAPVLYVAPDGMVHLDGPQSGVGGGYAPPPGGAGGSPTWRPFADDWRELRQLVFQAPLAPHYAHRHGFWGEFLYLRPRDADIAFATPVDGAANPVPIGATALLDPDFEPTFRVGWNMRLSDTVSVATEYTYLRSETNSTSSIDAAVGELRPLLMHPGTINALSDVQDATASLELSLDVIDTDLKGLMTGTDGPCQNCADQVNYIVGVRLAELDQSVLANYAVTGTTTVDTAVNFQGVGLRMGLEATRHASEQGLFAYGSGVATLLVGEFDASYRQENTFNGPEAFTTWSSGRVVPVLDVEVGLGWTGPRRHIRISGGYAVSIWMNMVTPKDFIEATQTFDYRELSGVTTFDGLVARAEWLF